MLGDPRTAGARPPFAAHKQSPLGSEKALRPAPDHGDTSY